MKKNFKIVVILSSILLLSFGIGKAQSNNTISGSVFNAERQPVADIYVELMNEVNSVIARKKTTSGGRYTFSGVSAGTFTIRVLTFGTDLEEQSTDVNIGTSGIAGRAPSENIYQDFHLRRRRNAGGSPGTTGTVFAQEVPDESKNLYTKAINSFAENKATEGIQFLEQALKVFPQYFSALEKLGQEYGAQENWASSYDSFKKAVTVNDRSFISWYGLSIASAKLQKADEALEAAQKTVSINSNVFEAQLLLGLAQRRSQKFEDAEKSLTEADKLAKGKSADVHWNLALLYAHNLKKYGEAANRLELYLKVNPDDPQKDTVKKLIKQFRDKAAANN